MTGEHIYFMRDGDLVKIGYTRSASSANKRLSKLHIGCSRPLTLIGVVRGGRETERFMHWLFRKYRVRGERFRIEGTLAEFVKDQLPSWARYRFLRAKRSRGRNRVSEIVS